MKDITTFVNFIRPVEFEGDPNHRFRRIFTSRELPGGKVNANALMTSKILSSRPGGSYAQELSIPQVSSILNQARLLGARITVEKKKRP